MHNKCVTCIFSLMLLLRPFFAYGQVLVEASAFNAYLFERKSIADGRVDPYLGTRYRYEWRSNMPDGANDLLGSTTGDELLRKDRLKLYPSIMAVAYTNGGHTDTEGVFLDASPIVHVVSRYQSSFLGRYGVIFWTRIEKHSVLGPRKISDLRYDFSWQKEIGKKDYQGNDSTWIEYSVGDGGILFTYPKGEIRFAKSNPIWGTGYTGQLWLSDKPPSYVFLGLRHRFTDKFTFSYFHGSLNSTFRDSSYLELYPRRGSKRHGLPLVRKYIAAHRLDFTPWDNMRVGLGESIIYGGRGVEMAYALPFLFYWTIEPDLGDSDNLQMFLDFEVISKERGRFYGSIYLDEWNPGAILNRTGIRNWAAYQVGLAYDVPLLLNWNSLFRIEFTHLTPYVYVHKSTINMFQQYGHYLGFWSGPNSDNIFFAVEISPRKRWWVQLYGQRTRRGEVSDETIRRQYEKERVPFLYRTYSGAPETRILCGLRGEVVFLSSLRVRYDLFYDGWSQRLDPISDGRKAQKKFDGIIEFSIGL